MNCLHSFPLLATEDRSLKESCSHSTTENGNSRSPALLSQIIASYFIIEITSQIFSFVRIKLQFQKSISSLHNETLHKTRGTVPCSTAGSALVPELTQPHHPSWFPLCRHGCSAVGKMQDSDCKEIRPACKMMVIWQLQVRDFFQIS